MNLSSRVVLGALPSALWVVFAVTVGCNQVQPEPEPAPKPSISAVGADIPDPPELGIKDLKVGEGREAKTGDKVKVNYVGRLLRTKAKFDSNESKDKPFEFTVGSGVIEGWSQGVVGMKKGGKRELTIPSRLAYGEHGSPPKIPANAPLVFEIELLAFSDEAAAAPSGSASAGPAASASASAGPATSASAHPAAGGSAHPAAASSAAPKK